MSAMRQRRDIGIVKSGLRTASGVHIANLQYYDTLSMSLGADTIRHSTANCNTTVDVNHSLEKASSFFLVYSDRPWLEHDGLIGVYDPRGLLRGLPGPAFLLFTIWDRAVLRGGVRSAESTVRHQSCVPLAQEERSFSGMLS